MSNHVEFAIFCKLQESASQVLNRTYNSAAKFYLFVLGEGVIPGSVFADQFSEASISYVMIAATSSSKKTVVKEKRLRT